MAENENMLETRTEEAESKSYFFPDVKATKPSDIWFDQPRFPDSRVAQYFLYLGRWLGVSFYATLTFWPLVTPDSYHRKGFDFTMRFFELTNWNCFLGFFLFSWLLVRRHFVQEDTLSLGMKETKGQQLSEETEGNDTETTTLLNNKQMSLPERVQIMYQNLPRTRFLIFLKEFSLVSVPIIAILFFSFLYDGNDFKPISSEWDRQKRIMGSNRSKYGELERTPPGGDASAYVTKAIETEDQSEKGMAIEDLTDHTDHRSFTNSFLQFLKRRRLESKENEEKNSKEKENQGKKFINFDYFTHETAATQCPVRNPDLSAKVWLIPSENSMKGADGKEKEITEKDLKTNFWINQGNLWQIKLTFQDFKYLERMEEIVKIVDEYLYTKEMSSMKTSTKKSKKEQTPESLAKKLEELKKNPDFDMVKLAKLLNPDLSEFGEGDEKGDKEGNTHANRMKAEKLQNKNRDEMISAMQKETGQTGFNEIGSFRVRAYEFSRMMHDLYTIRTFSAHGGIVVPWLFELIFVKHHFYPPRVMLIVGFGAVYFFINFLFCMINGVAIYAIFDWASKTVSAIIFLFVALTAGVIMYFSLYFSGVCGKKPGLDGDEGGGDHEE